MEQAVREQVSIVNGAMRVGGSGKLKRIRAAFCYAW